MVGTGGFPGGGMSTFLANRGGISLYFSQQGKPWDVWWQIIFDILTTTRDIVYGGILNYSYKFFSYKNLKKLSIMLFNWTWEEPKIPLRVALIQKPINPFNSRNSKSICTTNFVHAQCTYLIVQF